MYDVDKAPAEKETSVEPSENQLEDTPVKKRDIIEPVFLPIRLILGRKSLVQERKIEAQHLAQK